MLSENVRNVFAIILDFAQLQKKIGMICYSVEYIIEFQKIKYIENKVI